MSSESTVMDPQAQSSTENIILTYNGNFNSNPHHSRRNFMAHTRNSSFPVSSNPTSHRRVYSAKSLLRENTSGSNRNSKSKESSSNNNNNNNDNSEIRLINSDNSDSMVIEEPNAYPKTSSSDDKCSWKNDTPVPLSPSSSIRSVHQFTHIHKKRLSRTIQHISSFLQIVANITPTISFPITVEKTYTVERLARQIEAEYAFKFGGIEQGSLYEPLEVGLLYDVSMVALRFRDLVGDVLGHGDVVNVLNIYEDYNRRLSRLEEVDDSVEFKNSYLNIGKEFSSEAKTGEVKRYSMPIIPISTSNPTSPNDSTYSQFNSLTTSPSVSQTQNPETRFQAILSNKLGLNYFQKFAIREYSVENLLFWLDVELFAAGNSCDIEDNYFEEQQTSVIHAKYIYLTYISSNAPLQVNISDEIRNDITWPKDEDIVERNMFDEALEAVYQLMKGYTFLVFEDSPEWRECAKRKELDPEEYQSYEMIEPLERYFRPNMSLMLAVIMALDPSKEQQQVSHHYKEQTLHSTLSQYFPETILLDNQGKRRQQESVVNNDPEHPILNGYFNSENRLTNAQRMRKIKKERKLQWVFGEKVDGMDGQIVAIPNETRYGDDNESVISTISTISTISENRRVARDVWNRKKKVEKLEYIFGRDLKDPQLYSQNIFKGKRHSLTGPPNSPLGNQTLNSETCDSPHMQTMNELSAKDRSMLLKKTKKLQVMLGEALDEDMVRQTLTLPVIKSTSSEGLTVSDDKSFGSNGSFTKKRINRRASDSMVPPPIQSESIANTMLSLTPPASPSDEKLSNHTNSSIKAVPLIVLNKDTKEYRRKKLQKLYRFLGEKVPINAVLGEYDCDLTSLPPPSTSLLSPPPFSKSKSKKRPPNSLSFNKKNSKDTNSIISNTSGQTDKPATKLSAVDRKRHLQRAVKLQKMFGETPPQNLILSSPKFKSGYSDDLSEYSTSSSIDLHRRSIISLEYLMENDKEAMYELIDYMANSDEGEHQDDIDSIDQGGNSVSSAPTTPYLSSSSINFASPRKQKKVRGIRKLSQFFGATYGQMFPDQVLGELLGDLEREIREEAKQNNQLDKAVVAGLMNQLEGLRAKTGELGPDSGEDDGTTEGSAITDDEYSLEGLLKVTGKNHKTSFDSERILL